MKRFGPVLTASDGDADWRPFGLPAPRGAAPWLYVAMGGSLTLVVGLFLSSHLIGRAEHALLVTILHFPALLPISS